MSKDILRLSGMIFHAYHGLEHHEIANGQRFEVDVEITYDASKAAQTDRIKDTVDVRQVYKEVQNVVVEKRFYLIETISERIAKNILDKFDVSAVTVRVRKPLAPLGGLANGTEIEITRTRSE